MLLRSRIAVGFARSAATLTVTMGFGDFACQSIEKKFGTSNPAEPIDLRRVMAFSATGAFGNAPVAFGGLVLGDYFFTGPTTAALLRKIAFITVFVEPFRMASILATNQVLLGNGLDGAGEKVQSKLPTAWGMAAVFYPPILFGINRMPIENRMFVLAPAGVIFNTGIAYLAAQRKAQTSC